MIALMFLLLDDNRNHEVSQQMREGDKSGLFVLGLLACLLIVTIGVMALARVF